MYKNKLIHETSPYLLQHSKNPVNWYPWGKESLDKAAKEKKPILLSVGYSACHWCHVMAHESFEDPEIAKIMNQSFINIKIDREERPDIDQIYQTAHQILTQRSGGWPLTMFLDPIDQRPFFGGTYFPNEVRHGMPAFPDILIRVADYYDKQKDTIKAQGEKLDEVLTNLLPSKINEKQIIDTTPLTLARKAIEASFDKKYGGIGNAPKFPHPTTIERLLRHWRNSAFKEEPDIEALYLATLTLTRMAEGGIYDQLGGGFYRYSVDRSWQIPHFEKMLYDNGALLSLYAYAYLATGDDLFKKITQETAHWLLDDMQANDGGFFSTLNADSEGKEGTYYIWEKKEIEENIKKDDVDIFNHYFGLDQEPNFENKWHLTIQANTDSLIKKYNITKDQLTINIDTNKKILLQERIKRISPSLDDKQLTAWNALVIKGLAIADRALEEENFTEFNFKAINFIQNNHMHNNRLMACYKNGKARFPGYLDDYAYLLDALIESLQTKWHTEHLNFAIQLADQLLEYFLDDKDGGFFFTAKDHEKLIYRPKPMADNATPSGNGIASFALQRLGWLLGESKYLLAVEATLNNAWEMLSKAPHGHVSLINTLEEYLEHPEIIIIRGDHNEIQAWQKATNKIYSPKRMIFAIPSTESGLPGSLDIRKSVKGEVIAYHCKGDHCSEPISSFENLISLITETGKNQPKG